MKHDEQTTVLVVNDNPSQLRLASALLEKDGMHVLPCLSVEEAIEVMKGQIIDVIVTDLYMPGINGWRFCRMLRSPEYAAYNKVPILVLSATFSGSDAEQVTTDLGANAFLPAPYKPAILRAGVRSLLKGKKPQKYMRVLIIEDNERQAKALQSAFANHGYSVQIAPTGKEGGKLLKEYTQQVVILNDCLPDLITDKLLEEIKVPGSQSVALIITSDSSPERALQLIRKGADAYVRKPFSPEYIVELCEKARRELSLIRIEELLEERTTDLTDTNKRLKRESFIRERTEEEKKRLEELNRFKSQFVSLIAHEFRIPLTSLQGFSEILVNKEMDRESLKRWGKIILEESQLLGRLVNDILDLSRLEIGHLKIKSEKFSLEEILKKEIEGFRLRSNKHTYREEIPAPLTQVYGDKNRISQVLTNLIDNATRYSPEGEEIVVSAVAEDNVVKVGVTDKGYGIPEYLLEKIFEPFCRADVSETMKSGRTGLGLSISKTIIEAHGGKIWVENKDGKGSAFYFTTPMAKDDN